MTKVDRLKTQNQQRTSEQTRITAEEEIQIRDLTRDFEDAGTIASIANDDCSADQLNGHNRPLSIMDSLMTQKIREIDL
jgi:hypothetical protein